MTRTRENCMFRLAIRVDTTGRMQEEETNVQAHGPSQKARTNAWACTLSSEGLPLQWMQRRGYTQCEQKDNEDE